MSQEHAGTDPHAHPLPHMLLQPPSARWQRSMSLPAFHGNVPGPPQGHLGNMLVYGSPPLPWQGYSPMQNGYSPMQDGYGPVQDGYRPMQEGYGPVQDGSFMLPGSPSPFPPAMHTSQGLMMMPHFPPSAGGAYLMPMGPHSPPPGGAPNIFLYREIFID